MEHYHYFDITLSLLAQVSRAYSGAGYCLAQSVLVGVFWAGLLAFAVMRKGESQDPHEGLMVWGFGLGLGRELFRLLVAVLPAYGVVAPETLNLFTPPLEHAIFSATVVVLGAAFMLYLEVVLQLVRRFLGLSLGLVGLCYLVTYWWWLGYLPLHPGAKFGQTWGDLLFHAGNSLLLFIAIIILWRKTKGWAQAVVCSALIAIFLHEFLKFPQMALSEAQANILASFRHGFRLLSIPLLAYLYLRVVFEQRDRVKLALSESEQRFRNIVESVPMGMQRYQLTTDGRLLFIGANRTADSLMGVDHDPLIGMTMEEAFPSLSQDGLPDLFREVCQGGECRRLETIKQGPGLAERALQVVAFQAEPGIMAVFFDDITEEQRREKALQLTREALEHAYDDLEQRVRARTSELADAIHSLKKEIGARQQVEELLRQRELWYRNIVEDQTEMICRFSLNGEITFVNEAYCRPYCKHPGDLVGKRFAPPLPEEDRLRVDECLASLDAICQFKTIEHRVLLPDAGEYGWQQWTIRAIIDAQGTISEYQAVGRDITKQKNVEIALRLSEERFRTAFETAAHGMALVAPDGTWLKVNKALCAILGYYESELLQTNFQKVTHPDDLSENLRNARLLLSGEISSYQAQKRYLHKEGHEVWGLLSVSLVKDKVDQPLYFVSQIQDITARIKAEAKLIAAHADLEQRVRERTGELAAAYEKLHNYAIHQQTIKEQERLAVAREIHDELGQSLTGLKMGLSWLSKRVASEDSEIHTRIRSLSVLVDTSVETVHKIARELRPGLLDDLGLLTALEWQTTEFSHRYAIPCEFVHSVGDFTFNAEVSITLFRICQEALTNVSRHAEATKVVVSIAKTDVIRMEVRDNGKGITREQIANPQAFGLLGMRERLFPCHGTLEIVGREGEGTTVVVTIPVGEAELGATGQGMVDAAGDTPYPPDT